MQAGVHLSRALAAFRRFAPISPSASSQWQRAFSRLSEHTLRVYTPAGVSHPDERYPSSAPLLCEAFGGTSHHIKRLLFHQLRLPLRGLIGYLRRVLSPRCHRYQWKRVKKKKKKTHTQGHLRWIHPPPLELVTEGPPPISDLPPLRMRKCVLATV